MGYQMIERSFRGWTAITAATLILSLGLGKAAFAEDSGGFDMKMNGAIGATVIDGKNYQYFSFRPDFSFGKLGLCLDLSLYLDPAGQIRKEDWDKPGDYVDKVYYVRWGRPGDAFYVKVGSLDPITLGYGIMMRRYSNSLEYPNVRRVGMHTQMHFGDIGVEAVANNFREYSRMNQLGLLATRFTYDFRGLFLPIRFGATLINDGNQWKGAKDSDGDGVPDQLDRFPSKNDFSQISRINNLLAGVSDADKQALIDMGALQDVLTTPFSVNAMTDAVTEYGLDAGVPLIGADGSGSMSLWLYGQWAKIHGYGSGIAFPGASFVWGPLHAGAEFRTFQAEFLGDYFDYGYETERIIWNEATHSYYTRESTLKGLPSANGIWAEAGYTFFDVVYIDGSYQQMSYGGGKPGKSLYTKAGLKKGLIPKITLAEAFFQQPNATKVFSKESDGTVIGYRLGTEVGPGVSLIYTNQAIYHNGKPTRVVFIETALAF